MNKLLIQILITLLLPLGWQAGQVQALTREKKSGKRAKIGIALSGGGARGLAHIGFLRRLEEENIQPDMVAGASMGAVIAAFYALGYTSYDIEGFFQDEKDDIKELFSNEPERKFVDNYLKRIADRTMLEVELTDEGIKLPNSITNGHVVSKKMSKMIYASPYFNNDFNKLKYALRIVCTDIQNTRKVVFSDGDLLEIISGSIAYPAVFKPIIYKGMHLMDGGLTDNLPTDVLDSCNIKILSDMTYDTPDTDREYNIIELLDRISITMTREQLKGNLALADVIIKPEIHNVSLSSFERMDSLIAAGYRAADLQMPKIKELIAKRDLDRVAESDSLLRPDFSNVYFWSGNKLVADSTIERIISASSSPDAAESELTRYYKGKGFILSNVKREDKEAVINFNINEGVITDIDLEGNKITTDTFVKNVLNLKKGSVLTYKDAEANLNSLYGTDLFYRVSYSINDETGLVRYFFVEKPYQVIRFGANYETDRGFKSLLEYSNKNIFGSGSIAYLNYLFGEKVGRVEGSYYNSFFKRASIFYELMPYYQRLEQPFFSGDTKKGEREEVRYGVQLSAGFQFFSNYQGSATILREDVRDSGSVVLHRNSLLGKLLFDSRNNAFFPTNGLYLNLEFEKGWPDLVASVSYHKTHGQANIYFEPANGLNLSLQIQGGTADNFTPPSEQYRLGGKNFLPGTFAEQYVARQYFAFKTGSRFRIYRANVAELFFNFSYHTACFWQEPEALWRDLNFVNAIYLGLSAKTPVGPCEFGYGSNSSNQDVNKNQRFYISFGYEL